MENSQGLGMIIKENRKSSQCHLSSQLDIDNLGEVLDYLGQLEVNTQRNQHTAQPTLYTSNTQNNGIQHAESNLCL